MTISRLLSLPTDILLGILAHLSRASSLTRLSQTCRALHAFVSTEGWRVFIHAQHPRFHEKVTKFIPHDKPASTWGRWAEELTVTRSNWDNFGFLASGMFVEGKWRSRQKKNEEERRMGLRRREREDACVPVIDFREDWRSGEEVLVVGAGVNMLVRKRSRGVEDDGWWRYEVGIGGVHGMKGKEEGEEGEEGEEEKPTVFEILGARHRANYVRGCRDHPMDYTAVHLLGSHGQKDVEIAIVGRASGALEMVRLSTGHGRAGKMRVLRKFETPVLGNEWNPRIGKYTSILPYVSSENTCGLMSAGMGVGSSSKVALYRVKVPSSFPEFQVSPEAAVSKVGMSVGDGDLWSTNLLSAEHLAVTKTNSHKSPLCIYAIAPDGIRQAPLRFFSDPQCHMASTDATATARLESFEGEFSSGQVFLSAWSGGDLRMHDLRSPKDSVALWSSFITKPIRSLHTLDSRKFLMGHSEACMLRVLDIRTKYRDLEECILEAGEWSKYPRNWVTNFQLPSRTRPEPNDPVFALAVSPWTEKSVYAATPGMVFELNFAGTMTRAPTQLPGTVGRSSWKKVWKRSRVWKKRDTEKEMVEPVTLAVRTYNGLLWGLHHQQPPRKIYQRYM